MVFIKFVLNALLLAIMWIMLYFMFKRKNMACYKERLTVRSILTGFFMLALGTSLYEIDCIATYILGNTALGATFEVTAGILTSVTITLFLLSMLFAYKYHFGKGYDFSLVFLLILGLLKVFTVIFMYQEIKLLGNIILILFCLGIIILILKESFEKGDHIFAIIDILLMVYILCSIPLLFSFQNEKFDTFLILPKCLAILAIALLSIKELFKKPGLNIFKF